MKEGVEISEAGSQYYLQYRSSPHTIQKLSTLQKRSNFQHENRKTEILKFNNTINSSFKETFFYYFWKIENIRDILSDKRGISVRSQSFTIFGKR